MENGLRVGSRKDRLTRLFSVAYIVLSFLFILYASYPGYLYPDSVNQLIQIYTGDFDDWHPLFSTLVLYATHALVPGPFGYVVLMNLLVWGSVAGLVYIYSRRIGAWSLVFLLIPYLPGAYNMLGNVHKDVLLVGWLLGGSVVGYLANQVEQRSKIKYLYLVVSNLMILAAMLTRPNSVFAIVPLLIYINHGFGWRRNLVIGISLIVLMLLIHVSLVKFTRSDQLHPGDSIKTYQLLGLSYMQGKNLFPGQWTDEQARKIVDACYTPIQWDTAAYWGKCGFIHKELKRQKIWGSEKLTKAWLTEVFQDPFAILNLMSASFHKSIHDPNSRSMFYNPAMPKLFHWEVKMDPPRGTTRLVHDYVNSSFNYNLGRPLLFALLAGVALVLLTCTRTTINKDGLFAMALLSSGLLNILSYFILTVSSEYRYFYWSAFAVYLGFMVTVIATIGQGRGLAGISLNKWLKNSLFLLLGIAIGLVAATKPFPSLDRQVSLTPLDEEKVTVKSLRRASIPNWMGIKIDGDLAPHGWQVDEKGLFHANSSSGTLTTTIQTQGKAIEIEMVRGENRGRVRVESEGFSKVVDLSSSSLGDEVLYIWPTSDHSIRNNYTLWSFPLEALLSALSTIALVYWIDLRFKKPL